MTLQLFVFDIIGMDALVKSPAVLYKKTDTLYLYYLYHHERRQTRVEGMVMLFDPPSDFWLSQTRCGYTCHLHFLYFLLHIIEPLSPI